MWKGGSDEFVLFRVTSMSTVPKEMEIEPERNAAKSATKSPGVRGQLRHAGAKKRREGGEGCIAERAPSRGWDSSLCGASGIGGRRLPKMWRGELARVARPPPHAGARTITRGNCSWSWLAPAVQLLLHSPRGARPDPQERACVRACSHGSARGTLGVGVGGRTCAHGERRRKPCSRRCCV